MTVAEAPKKLPFLTGFCDSKFCEGTRAKDWTGKPVKTCPFWQTCPCDCHTVVTRMFEMAGMERVLQENPEYVPFERTWWMPSDEPDYGLPEPTPDSAEDVGVAEVRLTESGRVRKGGLEVAVQKVVLDWSAGVPGEREDCTVKYLSEQVYKNESGVLEKAPSLGAVAAVLDRWEKYGYVLLGHKPVRVIGLTPDGRKNGLDWCRARYKKEH
jgi:hypothetical protein